MSEEITILSSDLPESFLEKLSTQVQHYSVILLRIDKDKNGSERGYQIGSGTLVTIDTISGILTAQHVTNELQGHCWLGMAMAAEGQYHSYRIDKEHFQIIEIGIPKSTEFGPDLSFITLSNIDISTIKPYKSFYPLLIEKDEILKAPPSIRFGPWVMCGAPGEKTVNLIRDGGFRESLIFQQWCGFGDVSNEYLLGEFDYLDANIDYSDQTNPPFTFGGMSGGGLWQVIFAQKPDKTLVVRRCILSGVIFFQSSLEKNRRIIRCHGRASIYKNAINSILAESLH